MFENCFENLNSMLVERGDFTAVIDGDKSFQLSEILKKSVSLSYFVKSKKCRCVSVFLQNSAEYVISFYGLCAAGVKINLVHYYETKNSVLNSILQTKSDAVITDTYGLNLIKNSFDGLIICVDKIPDTVYFGELPDYPDSGMDLSNSEIYIHGGGTTGEYKTVVLTQKNLLSVCSGLSYFSQYADYSRDFSLTVLPFTHSFGLAVSMVFALSVGMGLIVEKRFNAEKALLIMQKYNVAMLLGVPSVFEKFADLSIQYPESFRNLKLVFCGGDFVPHSLVSNFNKILKESGSKTSLFPGYGLTETCSVCSVNNDKFNRDNSCGKPIDGIEIKIINDNNMFVPANIQGEIVVSGNTLCKGYLDSDNNLFFTDENSVRWLKTGDLGYVDDDGYLFVSGRKKRITVISGHNVYPGRLENALFNKFNLEFCLTEFKANNKTKLKLFVAEQENSTTEISEIFSFIKENFPAYYIPSEIIMLDALPHTELGKVDYKKLN